MVSIKEVAIEAGVSTATVSRVLSDKPYVRPELIERVMMAVDKLGYRPNLVARSLRSQQSRTIGLIVSDIRNPFFTAVSRAVEDIAYENNLTVLLCNTDEDPEKEMLYLRAMNDHIVSGLIFSPNRQSSKNFAALDLKIPTVVIDRNVQDVGVDMVLIDNAESAYRLTMHVIENGYRNIAAVFGEASVTGRERQMGFERALRESDLSPAIIKLIPPKLESGSAAVLEILKLNPRPDAIVTTNSLLLAGALKACQESGLAIPGDVALVGFDETIWTTLVQPPLTVISQPTDEIGRTAMELLLKRIENPDLPFRQVILRGQLIIRDSSAPKLSVLAPIE